MRAKTKEKEEEKKDILPAHKLKSETESEDKGGMIGALVKVALGGWIAYTSFVGHKEIFKKFGGKGGPGAGGKAI